jgi:predicted transposase/invertase (TIGR01784 family)
MSYEQKETKKTLNELTLLDRFLFAEVMEDPENVELMLNIILGKEIILKHLPQVEKEERKSPLYRYVRLDVWAQDENDTIYDAEVQKENTRNLPRRSRYYQGMIDSKLLEPGEIDFNHLNDLFIIMITPFDLFGENKYCYTFRMKCDEVSNMNLEDGAVRIFLNTHGQNKDEVSLELIELLHFIEYTNDDGETECKSQQLRKLQKRVKDIQNSAEVGVKYMQAWEERIMEQNQARAEGKQEGKQEAIIELIKKKQAKGKSIEQIADALEKSVEEVELLIKNQSKSS